MHLGTAAQELQKSHEIPSVIFAKIIYDWISPLEHTYLLLLCKPKSKTVVYGGKHDSEWIWAILGPLKNFKTHFEALNDASSGSGILIRELHLWKCNTKDKDTI